MELESKKIIFKKFLEKNPNRVFEGGNRFINMVPLERGYRQNFRAVFK